MLLTLLVLAVIQWLDGEWGSFHPFLRASVIWGLIVALSTELLSLLKGVSLLSLGLLWGVCLLASLGWLAWQLRSGKRLPQVSWPVFGARADAILFALTIVFVLGSLLVALLAPVQTYDSLSYHLSRVAHWTQNHSVSVYASGIERQNMMGPMAEYMVLQFYVLQRGDALANLVDWLAYLGCILAAAQVAGSLGARTRGRLIAAIFVASLPMALVQASSSMTDIVVAFWTMCALAEFTSAVAAHQATWRTWFYLSAACGLALLTKSTAAAFLLPFLLWVGIWSLVTKGFGWTAVRALLFLAIVAALNSFFWERNTRTYGTPLGSPELLEAHSNKILNFGVLASNVVRNLSLNFATPNSDLNQRIVAVISGLHTKFGMNAEDPRTTYANTYFLANRLMSEDRTGNPIHLLFIIIAAGIAIFAGRNSWPARWYLLAAAGTFLLFSIGNTFQVFGNRLLVPFFLIAAPLVGWALGRLRAWQGITLAGLLLLAGLPWLTSIRSRPLLPIRGQTVSRSILQIPRLDLYFANAGSLSPQQERVINDIRSASCTNIGLMLGGDDPEYLWWVLLGAPRRPVRLEWIVKGTPSARFADPNFEPCAVICTACPKDWETARGLPLAFESRKLRLFLKAGP
jgi:dolichyl-phosphate-mannose-protein mannosyltransferase